MLILRRDPGCSVIIGDNVTVTVLGVNGRKQVRLGITAPREIEVHRQEIYIKILQEKVEGKTGKEKKKKISECNEQIQTSHTDYMET